MVFFVIPASVPGSGYFSKCQTRTIPLLNEGTCRDRMNWSLPDPRGFLVYSLYE